MPFSDTWGSKGLEDVRCSGNQSTIMSRMSSLLIFKLCVWTKRNSSGKDKPQFPCANIWNTLNQLICDCQILQLSRFLVMVKWLLYHITNTWTFKSFPKKQSRRWKCNCTCLDSLTWPKWRPEPLYFAVVANLLKAVWWNWCTPPRSAAAGRFATTN